MVRRAERGEFASARAFTSFALFSPHLRGSAVAPASADKTSPSLPPSAAQPRTNNQEPSAPFLVSWLPDSFPRHLGGKPRSYAPRGYHPPRVPQTTPPHHSDRPRGTLVRAGCSNPRRRR